MNKANKKSINDQLEAKYLAKYDFFVEISPRYSEDIPEQEWQTGSKIYEELQNQLIDQISNAIEQEFGNQVQHVFEGSISTQIDRIEKGSIVGTVILVWGVGITVYEFVSKYRDFYDSLVLLRDQLRSIINRVLKRNLSSRFNSNVNVVLTRVPLHTETLAPQTQFREPPPVYSKAFFWYLIVMNILLLIVISLLVIPAIRMAYLSSP